MSNWCVENVPFIDRNDTQCCTRALKSQNKSGNRKTRNVAPKDAKSFTLPFMCCKKCETNKRAIFGNINLRLNFFLNY